MLPQLDLADVARRYDACECRRSSLDGACVYGRFSNGIKDWLWSLGRSKERWEDMEIFYVPQGMTNRPWDLNKEVFEHQFEVCTYHP